MDFFSPNYMPHGHCLTRIDLLWTHLLSDLIIAFSYFSIPLAIVWVIKKRNDVEFKGVFWLFASFILLCGVTHLFSIYTLYHGVYGIQAVLKGVTAIVSLTTAVYLYLNLDNFVKIPSQQAYEILAKEENQKQIELVRLQTQQKVEKLYKAAIEQLPIGILGIDSASKIIIANPALEEMFGYATGELIDKPISDLLLTKDKGRHQAYVDQFLTYEAASKNMLEGRVVQGVMKSKKAVYVEVALNNYKIDNSSYAFASVLDVGNLKLKQSFILERSNRLERAISASNAGVWEWNLATNEVWYSPKLLTLLNQNPDSDASIELWYQHIHPDDKANVERILASHFEEGKPYDVVYRGLTNTGCYEWLRAQGDSTFDQSGKPLLMSGTLANINHIKEIELKLAYSNKELERFAYAASHDLQEPLRKISAFSQSLKEKLSSQLTDQEAIYELDRIFDASLRMNNMVRSLLNLSRMRNIELNKRETYLAEILNNITYDYAEKIKARNVQISWPDQAKIFVDPVSFQLVCQNIISNAMHYTPPERDPVISISTFEENGLDCICIQDNGIGLTEDQTKIIFEPFKRLNKNMHKIGSGMGLAICKQIIRAHDGSIEARASTEGAKFYIYLPKAPLASECD